MKHANPDQIKKFHTLLTKRGLMHRKRDIVAGASNGRTESSRGLLFGEMRAVIDQLDQEATPPPVVKEDVLDRKRKRVIAQLSSAGYILPSGKPDMEAIYSWTRKQKHKKELNAHSLSELSDLITAAEGVAKHFISKL